MPAELSRISEDKLLLYLTAGFILAVIAGTLSHELGHYLVAKSLSFDAGMNYRSAYFLLHDGQRLKTPEERFLITLGGPAQTMLTGSVGFLLLYFYRRYYMQAARLSFKQWSLVFLSLFWLRQPANFVMWAASGLFTGNFSDNGDEVKISRYLGLSDWFVPAVTGIAGAIILVIVFSRFVPKGQRLTFLLSGLIGGIAGYFFWFEWAGKMILP